MTTSTVRTLRYLTLSLLLLLTGLLNAQTDTVQTVNGITFRLLRANPESAAALPGSYVDFHARMLTQAGKELFNTRSDKAQTLQVKGAVGENDSPIEVLLPLLRDGELAMLFVDLSQFPSRPPGTEGDSVLLYEVEIMRVFDEAAFTAEAAAKEAVAAAAREKVMAREEEVLSFFDKVLVDYRSGKTKGVVTTASGLRYVIHQPGDGAFFEKGDNVRVGYVGALLENGKVFDQSFRRGEGIPFRVGTGRVIPGWDEGILMLRSGTRATLFIPSALGYGENGAGDDIPPNADLAFYVEIE